MGGVSIDMGGVSVDVGGVGVFDCLFPLEEDLHHQVLGGRGL